MGVAAMTLAVCPMRSVSLAPIRAVIHNVMAKIVAVIPLAERSLASVPLLHRIRLILQVIIILFFIYFFYFLS